MPYIVNRPNHGPGDFMTSAEQAFRRRQWGAEQGQWLRQRGPKPAAPGPWTITPSNGNGFGGGLGTFGGIPTLLLLGGAGVLAWFFLRKKR
jgi:hypothetical protein